MVDNVLTKVAVIIPTNAINIGDMYIFRSW